MPALTVRGAAYLRADAGEDPSEGRRSERGRWGTYGSNRLRPQPTIHRETAMRWRGTEVRWVLIDVECRATSFPFEPPELQVEFRLNPSDSESQRWRQHKWRL